MTTSSHVLGQRFSREEYLAFEETSAEKHEYFQEQIRELPRGSKNHNEVYRRIFGELYAQLKDRDCEVFASETRLKIQATGLYTYCDVSVACKPILFEDVRSETLLNPRVLIEVLSPSTEDHDLGFKLKNYRKLPSLQEIFFFSQDEPAFDHYVREGKRWVIDDTAEGMDAVAELRSIGCRLELATIYAGVDFGE
jgi:Uma2 family endonuclease